MYDKVSAGSSSLAFAEHVSVVLVEILLEGDMDIVDICGGLLDIVMELSVGVPEPYASLGVTRTVHVSPLLVEEAGSGLEEYCTTPDSSHSYV